MTPTLSSYMRVPWDWDLCYAQMPRQGVRSAPAVLACRSTSVEIRPPGRRRGSGLMSLVLGSPSQACWFILMLHSDAGLRAGRRRCDQSRDTKSRLYLHDSETNELQPCSPPSSPGNAANNTRRRPVTGTRHLHRVASLSPHMPFSAAPTNIGTELDEQG